MPDRKDLNGLRIRLPGHPAIYLMDEGKKRHIPNPQVYNELFSTWERVVEDIDIDQVTTSVAIPETAILFKYPDNPKIYLLDGVAPNQVKRHIVNPAVMDRYCFRWDRVHLLPVQVQFDDGNPIKNPF